MHWKGKKIAVAGFGIEGEAAAAYLSEQGASLTICDKGDVSFLGERYLRWEKRVDAWQLGASCLKNLTEFDAVFRSPGTPFLDPDVQAALKSGVHITSGTKEFFERCPARVIGVTGTKGKGTTATLVSEMLKAAGSTVHLIGNIGKPALSVLPDVQPDDLVVFELSSFQLQDLDASPSVAVVLGVTVDHQDHHRSVEEYESAKSSIVRFQKAEDVTVATVDYPASERIASETKGKVIPISTLRPLEYGVFVGDKEIVVNMGEGVVSILPVSEIALRGSFNNENVVAAVAASTVLGVKKENIATVLRQFSGLPHRLELVREVEGVQYWDNSYATTPETTIAAIRSFDRPIVLMLGGYEKGFDYKDLGEAVLKSSVKEIVGIGASADSIYTAVSAAASASSKPAPHYVEGGETMSVMVAVAHKAAVSGDAVLLSPAAASFDRFKNVSDRGDQFKKAVLSL